MDLSVQGCAGGIEANQACESFAEFGPVRATAQSEVHRTNHGFWNGSLAGAVPDQALIQRLMHRSMGGQHAQWTGWWLQTPLDQCLVWNRSRQRSVPETVIRAMHFKLSSRPDRPELSEGFTGLIRLNPAGSHLKTQIDRALQTILGPSP